MKKLLSHVLLLIFMMTAISSYGQRVNRKYKNYAFKEVVDTYRKMYEKGDKSYKVLSRLANSYYNNSNTRLASEWYEQLVKRYGAKVKEEDMFRYAQSLRSNGNYKKSDSILLALGLESIQADESKIQSQEYVSLYNKVKGKNVVVHNLMSNTEYSDFGTLIHKDALYYASAQPSRFSKGRYKWNEQPFLNIYKSSLYEKPFEGCEVGSVLETKDSKILPSPVNTKYHEAIPAITKDGNTMYFTRDNFDGKKLFKGKDRTVHLKLYSAEKVDGVWTNIKELPFNSDDYSTGHPALSADEGTLYFISDMPGGFGGTDIYRVTLSEGDYGVPVNLGSTVNTSQAEMFPFVDANNTLYFSSNGHLGLGLLDIFETKKKDGVYSKPVNLQHPFNSPKDDFAFVLAKDGERGFFSSNRKGGRGDDDIYSFVMSDYVSSPGLSGSKVGKDCVQNISGTVRDQSSGDVVPFASIKLVNAKGIVIEQALTDRNGYYVFESKPCSSSYIVQGTMFDYRPAQKHVVTGDSLGGVKADLVLESLIAKNQIAIRPIYFDFNKSYIRSDASNELNDIVTIMNNHPNMVIRIESHTDSRGGKLYNKLLSDRRAKSTRDYIVSKGISSNRIASAVGYGEGHLLNHCDDANSASCSEEEHQLNRRSYFYILSGGDGVKVENTPPTVIDRRGGR